MATARKAARNIDEYIAGFSPDIQAVLEKLRATIRKAAPDAEESISYQIPTFKLDGKPVAYFAGHQKHIGFYPTPSGVEQFKADFDKYSASKGTLQFPLDEPIPYGLVRRVVQFRVKELKQAAKAKAKKK